MGLDAFLGPHFAKSRPDSGIVVEERCSNSGCRKLLGVREPKYEVIIKGKKMPYCRECALAILPKPKPAEVTVTEES